MNILNEESKVLTRLVTGKMKEVPKEGIKEDKKCTTMGDCVII